MVSVQGRRRAALSTTVSALALGLSLAGPASAIVINDSFTPAQAVDPSNITGVAQMIVDQQNGFLGLCTATLINPRTVIFASHCVNANNDDTAFRPGSAYGARFGGVPIGFGFQANDLPGVRSWFLPGPNQYKTNTGLAFYNSNYVTYDTDSTKLGIGLNFLQGDIALAALDTPASKIPTWTLLFSPVAGPTHVTIDGYGTNGTGTAGANGGIDYRRRVAENVLSVLGSLDDQDNYLFGAKDGLPQNLYQLDFNDPKKANQYDFNIFNDKALPREGITAPGDSGGPLIVDQAYSKPTVVAVLSGGDRFFRNQPNSSYGTTAFYQPLYLFWDYIVANNPYKYVSAQAGDGKWTDPSHWVMNLDPNYQVLAANGQPVNGLPTTPGAGIGGTTPKFGQVCDGANCIDLATNKITLQPPYTPTSNAGAAAGSAGLDPLAASTPPGISAPGISAPGISAPGVNAVGISGGVLNAVAPTAEGAAVQVAASATGAAAVNSSVRAQGSFLSATGLSATGLSATGLSATGGAGVADGSFLSAQNTPGETTPGASDPAAAAGTDSSAAQAAAAAAAPAVNPAPTPGNGLPGSTGFVPNDTDGAPAANIPPRYYDVTLSATGTTTLDTHVVVDRLTLAGGGAGLTITQQGSLGSLIDTTQYAGALTVDGQLFSTGDYALIGGLLQGTGTVTAPFTTSVAGVIAPGRLGVIGGLTIQGDVVLSSGSQLAIDFGPNGSSDLLQVQRDFLTGNNPGIVSLGGLLALNPVAGYRPRANDRFTFLTAEGGIQGNFAAVNALSAILAPTVAVGRNSVSFTLTALPYASVINRASPVQVAFAQLLDQNRGASGNLSNLFGELDLLSLGALLPTLESMAPYAETTKVSLARMQTDALARLWHERITLARTGQASGGLAVIGQPLLLAQQDGRQSPADRPVADDRQAPRMAPGVTLPTGVSAFVAGGYLDGTSKPLPGGLSLGRRDQLDGYYVAVGGEYQTPTPLTLGAAFAYSRAQGKFTPLQSARDELYQVAVYGSYRLPASFFVTSQVTGGREDMRTRRTFQAGTTIYNLKGRDQSPEFTVEADVGRDFHAFRGLTLTPMAGFRYTYLDFGPMAESGGDAALAYGGRDLNGLEGRFGGDVGGAFHHMGLTVRPHLTATYVHDFDASRINTPAIFFAGVGPFATFAGPKRTQDWGEVGGGVTVSGGRVDLNLSADTNIARRDLDYQTYRASVSYKF